MIRELTCIECPQGCRLRAEEEQGFLISLTGYKCPRGQRYAEQELVDPRRTLTSTVRAEGLNLAWVPVRTSAPIPKARLREAMAAIHALRLTEPVQAGDAIVPNFLDLGVSLLATRQAIRQD